MTGFAIWKFPIRDAHVPLEMPADARILSLQMQNGTPTLWATVDPHAATELRRVWVLPTGTLNPSLRQVTDACYFCGTVQVGELVFHVFIEYPLRARGPMVCT